MEEEDVQGIHLERVLSSQPLLYECNTGFQHTERKETTMFSIKHKWYTPNPIATIILALYISLYMLLLNISFG